MEINVLMIVIKQCPTSVVHQVIKTSWPTPVLGISSVPRRSFQQEPTVLLLVLCTPHNGTQKPAVRPTYYSISLSRPRNSSSVTIRAKARKSSTPHRIWSSAAARRMFNSKAVLIKFVVDPCTRSYAGCPVFILFFASGLGPRSLLSTNLYQPRKWQKDKQLKKQAGSRSPEPAWARLQTSFLHFTQQGNNGIQIAPVIKGLQ